MLDEQKKKLVSNRLKSAEGHVRGIIEMVDDDAYCMEILSQIKAVQKALSRVAEMTLETHLNTCVADAIKSKKKSEHERVVNEMISYLRANNKL